MDCLEAIRKERGNGQVISAAGGPGEVPAHVAASFGLKNDASCYEEIDAELAREIVIEILHRDISQGNRVMRLSRAEELAGQFMETYGKPPRRFWTNGRFVRDAGAGLVLKGWSSATSATFDTGVLAFGPDGSACLWVREEG
jgi:hypothetical protein